MQSRIEMKPIAFVMLIGIGNSAVARAAELELVRVAEDDRGFVLAESKRAFVPWGFNYDHDENGRLIEDYWEAEWAKVEQDFREMKELGANVVRVHLQFAKFMDDARTPNKQAIEQLGRLVALAEKEGLHLDLTGLGCYHKQDVPAWYDQLDEQDRWDAQARFWEAIAERCAKSNAIFCYDLMNEPVAPGGDQPATDWLGPAFAGKHFVQRIALDRKGRARHEIAQQWIRTLTSAIHKHDRRHMITVGLVDWSLDRPGLTSGFVPDKVAGDLDFIAVHLYPKAGKVDEAIETLKGFSVGKPVVVEEAFPLACSADELGEFFDRSKPHAAGWIGFYWGKTREECRKSGTIQDAIVLSWLELFERKRPEVTQSP
jgi:hypothetical protein